MEKQNETVKQCQHKMTNTCTGCNSVGYIIGSKEHIASLHFDKQTKTWWCYNCSGYAEVIYTNDNNTPLEINIITK